MFPGSYSTLGMILRKLFPGLPKQRGIEQSPYNYQPCQHQNDQGDPFDVSCQIGFSFSWFHVIVFYKLYTKDGLFI